MPLPKRFVEEGLDLAKGSMLFGNPLETLSREELIAAVAQGWKAEQRAREEGARRTKFALGLVRSSA